MSIMTVSMNLSDVGISQNRLKPDAISGSQIRLEKVSKWWGETTALSDVSLNVKPGKFTALLGPSGCGKSTALRLISGLEEPSTGRIVIGTEDVTAKPPSKRDIAMVFQSYALFPHLSVAENIIFGLRVRGVNRTERDKKLSLAADLLGLRYLLGRKPSQLSGGQQQRVALGRAIVADKSIFLMDEPLSNLDAKLRAEMREEIRDLQTRLGVTMLYVTHDQVEAVTMADEIVLMQQGQIEQVATPRQIYEVPKTLFAAKFIGIPPMSTFSSAVFGTSSNDEFNNITFGIRPEALNIASSSMIRATVGHVEYLGADAMMECKVNGEVLLCRIPGQDTHLLGSTVFLKFNPSDLHAFDRNTGQRLNQLPSSIETTLLS